MMYVNIHDAKTNLSKYIEQISQTHESIVICRNGKPVARLIDYVEPRSIKWGLLDGKIKVENDFDELPPNFMEHFT